MGWLSQIFGSAHDDIPLYERDILEIAPGRFDDDIPERYDGRVVNFQAILDSGRQPEISGLKLADQYIDWNSDDPYTRALETIRKNTFERINDSPELQNLLAKDTWTREDRVLWERSISEIVSEEHRNIPGLDIYRNVSVVYMFRVYCCFDYSSGPQSTTPFASSLVLLSLLGSDT